MSLVSRAKARFIERLSYLMQLHRLTDEALATKLNTHLNSIEYTPETVAIWYEVEDTIMPDIVELMALRTIFDVRPGYFVPYQDDIVIPDLPQDKDPDAFKSRLSIRFQKELSKIQNEHKLNDAQFADLINVNVGTIANWRTGSIPSSDKILRIAQIFDVTSDQLLGNYGSQKIRSSIGWTTHLRDDMSDEVVNGMCLWEILIQPISAGSSLPSTRAVQHALDERMKQFPGRTTSRLEDWWNISMLLKFALYGGAFRITEFERDNNLEKLLIKKYTSPDKSALPFPGDFDDAVVVLSMPEHLSACPSIVSDEIITTASAAILGKTAQTRLGVGGGYTILRTAMKTYARTIKRDRHFYALMAESSEVEGKQNNTASFTGGTLAMRFPDSQSHRLQYISSEQTDNLSRAAVAVRDLTAEVDAIFATCIDVRINGEYVQVPAGRNLPRSVRDRSSRLLRERPDLHEKSIYEYLGSLYTANDGECVLSTDNIVYTVHPEELKRFNQAPGKKCYLIASGPHKQIGLQTIIEHGYTNAIIVDSILAEQLLQGKS